MAKNYKIVFKSLRTGTQYTVHIGGGSGAEVELKGGSSPFMTQEDNNEDFFTPVRTQSGYLRVMDDGFAADGVTAFDWKDLLPATAMQRYVLLTNEDDDILWQGYIQAQNFSGELYGGAQEREFPVQCGVSAMEGQMVETTGDTKNFAYLIYSLFYDHDALVQYTHFSFQGGADAKAWLLTMVDWRNFTQVVSGDVVPKYTRLQVLDDVCRFWGWTCRTEGTCVYFSCMDDIGEMANWVTFTQAQMRELSASTSGTTGTTSDVVLSGDIFASMNNDETLVNGVKRAVLKVDVNTETTAFKFAPEDLRKIMGDPSIWVEGDYPMVGYFRTNTWTDLDGDTMRAYAPYDDYGGFERRSIFESSESDNSQDVDVMLIKVSPIPQSPILILTSNEERAYGGGSFTFSGTIFKGYKQYTPNDNYGIKVSLGIVPPNGTAQWFYMRYVDSPFSMQSGWSSDQNNYFYLSTNGSNIVGVFGVAQQGIVPSQLRFKSIPVADGLYGYLILKIWGMEGERDYEIADFTMNYTRDKTILPTTDFTRSRVIKKELPTTKEYSADNAGVLEGKWDEYSIFATDNGLEYGKGLIMNSGGGFVETVQYGGSSTNQQHPEQHLVNRVAYFYRNSKRMLSLELRKGAGQVNAIMPMNTVTIDSVPYATISVGHEWRDDVMKVRMIEI